VKLPNGKMSRINSRKIRGGKTILRVKELIPDAEVIDLSK
jgi:hypothetical protein